MDTALSAYAADRINEAYYDVARRCIFACASGFWTVADSRGFYRSFDEALRAAKQSGHPFVCLGDFSHAAVQRPEVVEANHAVARLVISSPVGRCAIVTSSTLKAMQLRRMIPDPRFAFFDGHRPALSWLGVEDR